MSVLKVGSIQPNSGAKVNITGSTLLVTTASGHFSGSYEGDGSRLEGVAGFPFTGSGQISGSLLVTGSSTLALRVSGSTALTGSLFVSGTVSGSFIGDGSGLTGLATNLTVDGDTGTQDVSLTADDLQILGTANEISTAVTKVSNDVKVTISLPDTVAVTASVATRANALAPTVTATSASTAINAQTSSVAARANALAPTVTATSASVAARATTLSAAATASFANISTLSRAGSGSFSGSFQGDGSGLTDLAGGGPFAQTGSFFATSNNIQITGSLNATSVTETSALRYKKSVKSLRSQSDNVYKLRPVHFKWKDDNRGDIGLIAEEVGEIYPELVSIGVDGNAEGISYTKLTAVLIKTIQELSARMDKLENKN